jgi:predicted enzyme related to lactoylglutathione lyase
MAHNIVHWELMGPDADQLATFYRALFGWNVEAVEGFEGYHMVSGDDAGIGGGIGSGSEPMTSYQTFYVEVDSVDEHLAKASANGASTVMERTVVPGMVTFGLFRDPAGNLVGVVEAETPAAE